MRSRYVLLLATAFCAVTLGSATLTGCAATPASACNVTPYINPVAVTLDHAASGTGNTQSFSAGYNHIGSSCVVTASMPLYHFAVSDPVDANTTGDDIVSCLHSSLAPITVRAQTVGYDPTTKQTVYIDTNLPTATLTCK